MKTFLEKVTRSPKWASRIAAASRISEARSRASRRSISGDIAIDPVRWVIRSKVGKVGRRVDIARKAWTPYDHRFDPAGARLLGVAAGTGLAAGKGKIEGRRRAQQQGVGSTVLGLGDDHRALPAGLEQG